MPLPGRSTLFWRLTAMVGGWWGGRVERKQVDGVVSSMVADRGGVGDDGDKR